MGEQEGFVECCLVGCDLCRGRHACQRFEFVVRESERNEAGAGRDDIKPELLGNLVGKARRPHLGDRFAASGHDEVLCGHDVVLALASQADLELTVMGNFAHVGFEPELRACLLHLRSQHGDDVFCRRVAEQLAEGFFMVGDAVFGHQRDEIPLRVTAERGFGEMRVLAEELRWRRAGVGKVAAPTARDADLFAWCFGVVHDQDAGACVACCHHASGTGPEDKRLIMHGG